MKLSNNLESKTLSCTYWRVQLVCMKVQTYSWTTTGIQSGSDVFDKCVIYYPLFKYLGSYRNIIQFSISSRKAGKGMPDYSRSEFIEKFLANNCSIRYIRQHLRAIEKRRYSRFTFVKNPISDLSQISKATFLQSDWLFCFISIYKFDSFKNPFVTITSLSELYFRFRRFILLVQTKMVISMNYGSSKSC